MRRIPRPLIGLTLCALTACLSACAADCPPPRPAIPPAVYLQDVPEPQMRGRTNGDLANWALEVRQALRQSNSDKAALRAWVKELAR